MKRGGRSAVAIRKQIAILKDGLEKRLYQAEASHALGAQNALEWAIGISSIPPSQLFEFTRQIGRDVRRRERTGG